MDSPIICFVVMPFETSLHYLFVFLKNHLEITHQIQVERADTSPHLGAIIDDIKSAIKNADFIIADCTGNNPNVFYELGIAHSYSKPTILITQSISELPFDVSGMRTIEYAQDTNHLVQQLDAAIHYLVEGRYQELYEIADQLFNRFAHDIEIAVEKATEEVFRQRMNRQSDELIPEVARDDHSVWRYVLPKIVLNSHDPTIQDEIWKWLGAR